MYTNDPQLPYRRVPRRRFPEWAGLLLWWCIGVAIAYQLLKYIFSLAC
jgi:hypothetical protein